MHSLDHRSELCVCVAVFCLVAACGGKQRSEAEPSSPMPSANPTPSPALQPSAANEPAAVPRSAAPTDPKLGEVPPAAAPTDPKPAAPHADAARKPPDPERKPSSAVQPAKPPTTATAEVKRMEANAPSAQTSPAASVASGGAATGPCGEKGQPRCPLQEWMEDQLQVALDRSDMPALAKGLTRAASFVPNPSWNAGAQGWAALANAGADAAKNDDLAATKASCKSCHKAWRTKYKQTYRKDPIVD